MCGHTVFVAAHRKPSNLPVFCSATAKDYAMLIFFTAGNDFSRSVAYFHSNGYNIRKGLTCCKHASPTDCLTERLAQNYGVKK